MKQRRLRTHILILLIFGFARPAAAHEVPAGKTAVLVGQDNATIEKYIEGTGHVPAGFMMYIAIHDLEGLETTSRDHGAGTFNADELLEKYPGRAIQIGIYMVGSLRGTAAGEFDGNIDRLAEWMKRVKVPVFLRIGYEFEGPHNAYDPEDYKKAYVHIVDRLRAAGVTNADYVWHSWTQEAIPDIAPWYPGDDYVDWVGISYFDQSPVGMTHVVDFARARNKPLMIAEATPAGKTLDHRLGWEFWFVPFFRFIEQNDVRVVSYINSHWDAMPMWQDIHWGDARIEAYPQIKPLWLEKMREARYTFQW